MSKANIKGSSMGLISAIMWGLDTVLMGLVLGSGVFIKDENAVMLAPLISTFLHDSFSAIWTSIYLLITKKYKGFIKAIRSKSGSFVILGALLGGPIGMTGYLLAIKYLGPSYTAAISSIYPAFGAVLAAVVLKEKVKKSGWIGLGISIVGIILLGYSTDGKKGSLLGLIFVLLCIIGWGSEAVICGYGMKDNEVTSEHALQIRQLTSGVVYGLVIIPLVKGFSLVGEAITGKGNVLLILTALAGTISYICYYGAINKIGATKAMGINITYVVWAILLDTIILSNTLSIKTIILGSLIMLGSYIVAREPSN